MIRPIESYAPKVIGLVVPVPIVPKVIGCNIEVEISASTTHRCRWQDRWALRGHSKGGYRLLLDRQSLMEGLVVKLM